MPLGMPIYVFRYLPVMLRDGSQRRALTCVADTSSHLYHGDDLDLDQRALMIARAAGPKGTSRAYLTLTVRSLAEQGTPSPSMLRLLNETDRQRRVLDDEIRDLLDGIDGSLCRSASDRRHHDDPAFDDPAVDRRRGDRRRKPQPA